MKKYISIVITASVLCVLIGLNYSCQPEANPRAVIQVVDENNKPVEDAKLSVKAINSDDTHTIVYLLNEEKPIEDVKYSDKDGKVYYDFKYESIYKIEVTVDIDRDHEYVRRGKGVLILENDKTKEAIIKINEQTTF